MSSSTGSSTSKATRRTGNSDCGFTSGGPQAPGRSSSSSSDFRRWSRNLSSRRHKELHRLNEIERRRQLLELRRQNDLFDQMSVTAAGNRQQAAAPVDEAAVDPSRTGGDDSAGFSGSRLDHSSTATRDSHKDKGFSAAVPDSGGGRQTPDAVNTNDPTATSNPSKRPQRDDGSTTTAVLMLETAHRNLEQLASSRELRETGREPEDEDEDESVGSFSSPDDREDETGDDELESRRACVGIDESRAVSCMDADGPPADAKGNQPVASDYQAATWRAGPKRQPAGDKTLISESLARLVCMPVPKDKRFLCWIVREKVSKLSKARPYFYPTYYLYIQSIVDIHNKATCAGGDNLAVASLARDAGTPAAGLPAPEPGQQVAPAAKRLSREDSELISEHPLDSNSRVQPPQPATSSADNSISASSSISADMLFMEALGRGTGSVARPPRANSYSDTEVCVAEQPLDTLNESSPDMQQERSMQLDVVECFFDELRNPYSGANGILLAARRRKKTKTYLIGPNECGYARKNCICKLKSNVLGTNFSASLCSFDDSKLDEQYSIASIGYETNVLGFRGPRKMRVFLPKESCKQRSKELPDLFKKKPSNVIHLKNMTPSWNIESQSYVLNFNGRVTQASVKNFQLIECDREPSDNRTSLSRSDSLSFNNNANNPSFDYGTSATGIQSYNNSIVMQFGRISNHEFTCDITHPMSILQGFAIALSSLDSKLACE